MADLLFVARSLVERLTQAGHTAYYAGGWVRDMLLGLPSADIDIATSATPEQVTALFDKTIPVGAAFGSVIVVEEGHTFEVTTFRTESGYSDGRHPDSIAFASAEEDAKRRSITINGMFYDPLKDEVIDYVGGRADLEAGIVRAIGDPYRRFAEDRLRMIRAVRFATRFSFELEQETRNAIIAQAHTLLPAVAMERIWQEFCKMRGNADFLAELHRCQLLQQIFPEATNPQPNFKYYPDETPAILYLLALFPDLQNHQFVGERLKVSNEDLKLIRLFDQIPTIEEPVDWVHFYAEEMAQICLEVYAAPLADREQFLSHHQRQQQKWAAHIERIKENKPLVTAQHLMERGVEPGPRMGELLRKAEAIAVRENLSDPKSVLNLILS